MNVKLIIFSGIVTAALGFIMGLAIAQIGQKDFNRLHYESQFYDDLNDSYGLIGAGLGFAIGTSQECVRELKKQRDREGKKEKG
jgi:hypothetical protein